MAAATLRKPIALLLPDPDTHTKLKLNEEGLELLRAINDPVAIISVVGAYRTGKSWLLNELMQIGCGEGFVVGHERHAQTKGIWLLPSTNTSSGTIRVFMDTEGMDASGQTEVYDDRIFAFAALISSVLVYNLAETIKQADIERLAFAAQLSNEFWRRATQGGGSSSSSSDEVAATLTHWRPPALLWLVQRDFLQGGSVSAYLEEAMKPTDGATDEHVKRLNTVRTSLEPFNPRMRAMGLVQPHVRRTELCSLPRDSFDPAYIKGAEEVRGFVFEHAISRRQQQQQASLSSSSTTKDARSGSELASLISRIVDALNTHEIPTAGSVVEAFNNKLIQTALATLQAALKSLSLPMDASDLAATHNRLLEEAERTLNDQSFGASHPEEIREGAKAALAALNDANFVASQRACDAAWSSCESSVRSASKGAWLPSTSRYAARIATCNATLTTCIGPASAKFHNTLLPQLATEGTAEYVAGYKDRLHRSLVVGSVVGVLLSRFCLKSALLETLCGLAFVCLELLPALVPFGFSWLGSSERVQRAVELYEAIVFNPIYDLDQLVPILVVGIPLLLIVRRWRRCRRENRRQLKSWGGGVVEVVVDGTAKAD